MSDKDDDQPQELPDSGYTSAEVSEKDEDSSAGKDYYLNFKKLLVLYNVFFRFRM